MLKVSGLWGPEAHSSRVYKRVWGFRGLDYSALGFEGLGFGMPRGVAFSQFGSGVFGSSDTAVWARGKFCDYEVPGPLPGNFRALRNCLG